MNTSPNRFYAYVHYALAHISESKVDIPSNLETTGEPKAYLRGRALFDDQQDISDVNIPLADASDGRQFIYNCRDDWRYFELWVEEVPQGSHVTPDDRRRSAMWRARKNLYYQYGAFSRAVCDLITSLQTANPVMEDTWSVDYGMIDLVDETGEYKAKVEVLIKHLINAGYFPNKDNASIFTAQHGYCKIAENCLFKLIHQIVSEGVMVLARERPLCQPQISLRTIGYMNELRGTLIGYNHLPGVTPIVPTLVLLPLFSVGPKVLSLKQMLKNQSRFESSGGLF